jgi:ketosteroid isomerase-like protein
MLTCATATAAPRDDALAVVDRWAAAFAASDVDAITNLYAPDATFIGTSSMAVLTGHAAIRGYFDRALNEDRPRVRRARGHRRVVERSCRHGNGHDDAHA